MAMSQSAVSELLEAFRTGEGVNLIHDAVQAALQDLIEAEATSVVGAGRYERTTERTTQRNGSRPRTWICSYGSRSCGRAPSSRASLSRAAASIKRCTRS